MDSANRQIGARYRFMKSTTLGVVLAAAVLMLNGCSTGKVRGEADPEQAARIYADLGLGYLRQGDLELALEKLERSLELNKKNPNAHHYIAEVYKQFNDPKNADSHYKLAIKYDDKNAMVLNNYGAFLCGLSRFQEAERHFLQAADMPRYRTPELAYENLGLCAMNLDNREKAVTYFRKALKLQPELPKSLYHMALISLERKEYMRGRAFVQRLHGSVDYTPASLELGIRVETALKDQTQVEKYKKILNKRFPEYQKETSAGTGDQ